MIHLVGVEHGVQSIDQGKNEDQLHIEYRSVIEHAITNHKPRVVAEEFNEEALQRTEIVRDTPQEAFTKRIAVEAGIEHLFCEPDLTTKLDLGYQGEAGWLHHIDGLWDEIQEPSRSLLAGALHIARDFPLREAYWLEKIKSHLANGNIIFVCGDGHIETFRARLLCESIDSEVVKRQIGMSEELVARNQTICDFLKQNGDYVEKVFEEILERNGGKIHCPHDPRRSKSTQD